VLLDELDEKHRKKVAETRVSLIKKELDLAGIRLASIFPAWARSRRMQSVVLGELLVAMDAHVHEGLIPPYGSLIVPNDAKLERLISIDEKALPLARKAADGTSGLLVFHEDKPSGMLLLDPASAPDLQLATLARETDGVAFLRARTGVVRSYSLEGALRHAGRQWSRSPSIYQAQQVVLNAAPMVSHALLADVLSFAYYVLSPWYIGSTIVWLLNADDCYKEQGVDLQPLKLSVQPKPDEPSIAFAAHLLAQHDGATIIDLAGNILRTNVLLAPSDLAVELIPAYSGTRHTSARRTSFDLGNAIIVTVSADGPVTIFSDGLSILELWFHSSDREAAGLDRVRSAAGVEDSVWTNDDQVTCPRCGKTSNLSVVVVAGWKEDEEAYCPICKTEIATRRCFTINANVVKKF
jgi:hypothetical protein